MNSYPNRFFASLVIFFPLACISGTEKSIAESCRVLFEILSQKRESPAELHQKFITTCCQGNEKQYALMLEYAVRELKEKQKDRHGVTDDELLALRSYLNSSQVSFALNKALRENSANIADKELTIRLIHSALSKLPNYEGTVYRSVSGLTEEQLSEYVPGNTIHFAGFTSTSSDPHWLEMGRSQIHYVIHTKRGKDILGFGGKQNEYEILLQAGTSFKVVSKTKKPDGAPIQIVLDEQ